MKNININKLKPIFNHKYFPYFALLFLISNLIYVIYEWENGPVFIMGPSIIILFFGVLLQISIIQINLKEAKNRKVAVNEEGKYIELKTMISKFPELSKIANDHMIFDIKGNKRISLFGFKKVQNKYDKLYSPIKLENDKVKKAQSIQNINRIISEI